MFALTEKKNDFTSLILLLSSNPKHLFDNLTFPLSAKVQTPITDLSAYDLASHFRDKINNFHQEILTQTPRSNFSQSLCFFLYLLCIQPCKMISPRTCVLCPSIFSLDPISSHLFSIPHYQFLSLI